MQLIFARRVPRTTPGRFRARVLTRGVAPSLHLDYKRTRIKQYHKEGSGTQDRGHDQQHLRLQHRQAPGNLPALRQIGFAANRPLLNLQRLSHDCLLAEAAFQATDRPVNRNGQRASGLRFADPKVHQLWHALLLFRLLPDGFRSADLRRHLIELRGCPAHPLGPAPSTYQLRRLRLHGMIERRPHTHRYHVTDLGRWVALFFTRAYNRLQRPNPAAVLLGHLAEIIPLRTAFDTLDRRLNACLVQHNLAA